MIKLLLFFPLLIQAGTLLSNTGASFSDSVISVRVASNTDCSKAGITKQEIIDMVSPSIDNYWNTVSTSSLRLNNSGELQTSDALFNTGVLCTDESSVASCSGINNPIPKVEDIVITCNNNTTNYSSNGLSPENVLAITLPNNIRGSNFLGAIILINNTENSPFKNLSAAEKEAVIAHEIGHAIGLGHSENDGNLMFWTPTPERFLLGPDDADAVTYLYPKKFDACGLAGTIHDNSQHNKSMWLQFLISILLFLGSFIIFEKVFFKLKKFIS